MRFTRKLIRFLVLLFVILYAGAHLCIRIGFVQRQALESFSRRAGYTVEASKVRFTAGLSWTLRDVRLSYMEQGATNVVFTAPVATVRSGRGGFAHVPRGGEFFARRSGGPTGVWTPSQAQTFGQECCAVEAFRKAGLLFGAFTFDVVDASIFVIDEEGKQSVFAGVNWSRLPACIPGHPGAIAAKLSYQRASGLAIAAPETLPATQWLELGGKLVDLEERPAPPPPSPSVGVIGGDDGPTSIWLAPQEPPSKQDMVEAFREFFKTDPETAKAFFEDVGKAIEESRPQAQSPAPAPAATPAPAPAPAPSPAPDAKPAPAATPTPPPAPAPAPLPAPAPDEKRADSAEGAAAPAPTPAP